MLFLESVRNRMPPGCTEVALCDANAGRGLAAFVFVDFDQVDDAMNVGFTVTSFDDFRWRQVLLNVSLHDGIEYFVGWKTILVGLVEAQFC